jgi:thymidylate synthase
MVLQEPIIVTYEKPLERVLTNPNRDANPFFHLYEALWMLAGRNDVAPLKYYNSKVDQFSDGGETFNGAYGHRWRYAKETRPVTFIDGFGGGGHKERVDQLDILVAHLKADRNSRRAVLNMWNVEGDLLKVGNSKDVCCNLEVMFSIRSHYASPEFSGEIKLLDMTVTNRSNDMVWGMLGANYVHFSFLQEYMAAKIGVDVGVYNQFSNNLHVYDWNWKPDEWNEGMVDYYDRTYHPFRPKFEHVPLVDDPETFDAELQEFVETHENGERVNFEGAGRRVWKERFFREVAHPMMCAFHCHKAGAYDEAAIWLGLEPGLTDGLSPVRAHDWAMVAEEWIDRRKHMKEAKK